MQGIRTSIITVGALAALAMPAGAQSPAPELTRADLEAWMDGYVPEALRKADIAGLVVSVVKDGKMLFARGYGYADLATKKGMNPDRTVLRVASVSKSFTATAVMQLVEQGRLNLDRDVNAYLDFKIPATFEQPITLRHLLTHTAGFEETSYKRSNPPATLHDHVAMVPDRIYPPGTIPAYSNYGLSLAGYIVWRVTGETIAEYVDGRILDPLGMESSSFRMTLPKDLEPSLAKNYSLASTAEEFSPALVAELMPQEAPAAALATTGIDMTRFMLAHLQEGRVDSVRLMGPEAMHLMHDSTFTPIPGAQPIALGLFRSDYKGHRVLGHSGDGEGEHAEMKLLPDENVGFFVAMNSDGAATGFLPAAFTLRADLFEKFVDRYFPTPPTPEERTAPTAREHARLIAGEYAWSRQQKGDYQEAIGLLGRYALKLVLRANADGTIETPASLTFEPHGRSQTWREVGPFVWREVGGTARLVANVKNGKVESLWTDQSPSFWVDLPVPAIYSARLNVPLFLLSAIALVLTVLSWPVTAVRNRRRGTALPGREQNAYRWSRLAAVLGVIYILCWAFVVGADLASRVGSESWIRLIQVLGIFCIAGAGVAVWNAAITWRGNRSVWARAGSLATALALAFLVWFSFAFHLISARIN